MFVVINWDENDAMTMFGPFKDRDSASEWATKELGREEDEVGPEGERWCVDQLQPGSYVVDLDPHGKPYVDNGD